MVTIRSKTRERNTATEKQGSPHIFSDVRTLLFCPSIRNEMWMGLSVLRPLKTALLFQTSQTHHWRGQRVSLCTLYSDTMQSRSFRDLLSPPARPLSLSNPIFWRIQWKWEGGGGAGGEWRTGTSEMPLEREVWRIHKGVWNTLALYVFLRVALRFPGHPESLYSSPRRENGRRTGYEVSKLWLCERGWASRVGR